MRHQNGRGLNGERLATGLGWFSVGLGITEVLAPGALAKAIGARGDRTEEMLRAFGAREIGTGMAILANPSQPAWLWSRVSGDVIDLAYLLAQLGHEDADSNRLHRAILGVAGVTALDIACALQLNQAAARQRAPRLTRNSRGAVKVERVVTINRPIEEVYRFWRNFENFPRFMRHLESVERTESQRSHWRAKAPAGMTVEWDAEILQDRENEWIAWRSVPGSQIENSGSVRFQPAPGSRGTEVRVQLQYAPPAGGVGRLIAKLFGEEPDQQIRDDLRRFKQLMEAGEIPISDGPSLRRPAQPPEDPAVLRMLAGVPS